MANIETSNKERCTFTLDPIVKKKFQIACTTLDLKMSEVIEAMMINFVDISKKSIEQENKNLYGEDDSYNIPVVFAESTRLKEE